MPHIKRFAGASAGAITAALLAAGLNSAQLFTELGNQRAAAAQTRDASGANVRTRERLPAVAAPCGVARSPLSLLPAVAASDESLARAVAWEATTDLKPLVLDSSGKISS